MAREPWHSLAENVHHQHGSCVKGSRAAACVGALRTGDGGKLLCEMCEALVRAELSRPDVAVYCDEG